MRYGLPVSVRDADSASTRRGGHAVADAALVEDVGGPRRRRARPGVPVAPHLLEQGLVGHHLARVPGEHATAARTRWRSARARGRPSSPGAVRSRWRARPARTSRAGPVGAAPPAPGPSARWARSSRRARRTRSACPPCPPEMKMTGRSASPGSRSPCGAGGQIARVGRHQRGVARRHEHVADVAQRLRIVVQHEDARLPRLVLCDVRAARGRADGLVPVRLGGRRERERT